MSSIIDVYIFRHGETDYNAETRFQGSLDIPLNDQGRQQAKKLAKDLESFKIQKIYTSPQKRALETATIVANQLKIDIDTHAGLVEIRGGNAEGKTRPELISLYGADFLDKWLSVAIADMDTRFPQGESKKECQTRGLNALTDIANSTTMSSIGISCHGAILRHIIHAIIGVETDPVPTPNCVVYQIQYMTTENSWKFIGKQN